jgi:hypothetical protein
LPAPLAFTPLHVGRRDLAAFVEIGCFHHLEILEEVAVQLFAESAGDDFDALIIETGRQPNLAGVAPLRLDALKELQRLDAIRPHLELFSSIEPTAPFVIMIELRLDHLRVGAKEAHLLGGIVLARAVSVGRARSVRQAPRGAF